MLKWFLRSNRKSKGAFREICSGHISGFSVVTCSMIQFNLHSFKKLLNFYRFWVVKRRTARRCQALASSSWPINRKSTQKFKVSFFSFLGSDSGWIETHVIRLCNLDCFTLKRRDISPVHAVKCVLKRHPPAA